MKEINMRNNIRTPHRKHDVLTLIYKKFQIEFIWVDQRDIFFILTHDTSGSI